MNVVKEVRPGYVVGSQCATCNAKDRNGQPLRDWIDTKKDSGMSTTKIVLLAREEGVYVSQPNMDKHFNKHSPWLKDKKHELAKAKLAAIQRVDEMINRNAEEELQKLVNIGGQRVDDGEIIVDKDLYMFALDRQTRSKQPFSIQNLVMNFGQALTEKKPLEEVSVIDGSS